MAIWPADLLIGYTAHLCLDTFLDLLEHPCRSVGLIPPREVREESYLSPGEFCGIVGWRARGGRVRGGELGG